MPTTDVPAIVTARLTKPDSWRLDGESGQRDDAKEGGAELMVGAIGLEPMTSCV